MRLKELREHANIMQKTIADHIGCSPVVYSRYETGARMPSIDVLIRIADFYSVSLDYLVGRSESSDEPTLNPSHPVLPVADRHAPTPAENMAEDEKELLALYRSMNDVGRSLLTHTARTFAGNPEMQESAHGASAI